jgi:hypothetical protein
MKNFQAGKETYQIRLYVGHDGSMIRLAAGLGIGKNERLRWPALGSEIIIEVRFFILNFFVVSQDAAPGLENNGRN